MVFRFEEEIQFLKRKKKKKQNEEESHISKWWSNKALVI